MAKSERVSIAMERHSMWGEVVSLILVEAVLVIIAAQQGDVWSTGKVLGVVLVGGVGSLLIVRSLEFAWHYVFTAPKKMVADRDARLIEREERDDIATLQEGMEDLGDYRRSFWPTARRMFHEFCRLGGMEGEDLNSHLARCVIPGSAGDSATLISFAASIYPDDAEAAAPEFWHQKAKIAHAVSLEEFVAFDKARRELRRYWQHCADRLDGSEAFNRFMETRALVVHPVEYRLIAYLDVAMARITGKAHILERPDPDYPGWRRIDRFVRSLPRPSTPDTESLQNPESEPEGP